MIVAGSGSHGLRELASRSLVMETSTKPAPATSDDSST